MNNGGRKRDGKRETDRFPLRREGRGIDGEDNGGRRTKEEEKNKEEEENEKKEDEEKNKEEEENEEKEEEKEKMTEKEEEKSK